MVRHTALAGLWALMMVVSCSLSASTDKGRRLLWRWPAALHRNSHLTAHNWWQLRKTQAVQLHIHLHQFLLTWERFHYCRKRSSELCIYTSCQRVVHCSETFDLTHTERCYKNIRAAFSVHLTHRLFNLAGVPSLDSIKVLMSKTQPHPLTIQPCLVQNKYS